MVKCGFTLLETLIVIIIMSIVIGMMLPMLGDFNNRRDVENSALMLLEDIRKTQQFARVLRGDANGNYSYYGIRFFNNLGPDNNRYGYKIIYFYRNNPTPPPNRIDPNLPIDNNTTFSVVKSSVASDNPEYLENTYFPDKVTIGASSELNVNETIVFNAQGSATTDGTALLLPANDQLTLTGKNNFSRQLSIAALTGYVKIE